MFKKKCPGCNKLINYKSNYSLKIGIGNNTRCRPCSKSGKNHPFYGKKHTKLSRQKMKENRADVSGKNHPWYGRKHTKETKRKIGLSSASRRHTKETRQKMSNVLSGKNNPMYGKHHTEETKQKMSISAINRIKNGNVQITPNYSPNACKKIDEYNEKHGYTFQHAENGGEMQILRFWVDGYDKERNTVIEIYENAHKYTIERDERRKQKIINHLGCEFIEIKEWEL